jgi:hypothetical protein
MNFRITLYEAVCDPILFTNTLPNSVVPYFEQYYKMLMLDIRLISTFWRNIAALC